MVKEITAYSAEDGTVFKTEREALEYDAKALLSRTFQKDEHVNMILQYKRAIQAALGPLLDYEDQAAAAVDADARYGG